MSKLKKFLNRTLMQQILDSFNSLTEIRAAFFDNTNESIMGNNMRICSFCSKLRQQSGMLEECKKSDHYAFKISEASKTSFLYKCHAGLWEAVIPLFVRNTHVGYLMLGQVKCDDKFQNDWLDLNKILSEKGSSADEINSIRNEYEKLVEFPKHKIEAAVKMLDIISQYLINSKALDLLDSGPVEKAKTFIEENYLTPIPSEKIGAVAGVSPAYLSKIFHDELGETITTYIENCRLKHACELLRQTSLSIKEISYASGYDDQNYFCRVFKKRLGITPTEYKQHQRVLSQ